MPFLPYLATQTHQAAHGRFTTIALPTTSNVPLFIPRLLSEPELDRIVAGAGSNRAPTNADGAVLLSPATKDGSPQSSEVRETSSTVQRLAAMVKEQQKTIELLLQEVTRRLRRKSKIAETRQSGTAKDAQGPPASTPSTSGAIAKTRTKRGVLGQIARVNAAETRSCGMHTLLMCEEKVSHGCESKSTMPRLHCRQSTFIADFMHTQSNMAEKDTWTVRPKVYKLSDLATNILSPLKRLELTHDLGNVLCVYVQEFTPVEGDLTLYTHKLKDGSVLTLEMPCYAIAKLADTKAALNDYVDKSLLAYLEDHFDDSDFLIWEMFQLAIKRACWQDVGTGLMITSFAQLTLDWQSQLLKTLRLWMASHLTKRPWRICSEGTLGMTIIDDPKSPFCGCIPIPLVVDTQLDQVAIQSILDPLRQQVLKLLNERISKKSRKDWFEIYATIFILLNNVEVAIAHDHDFAHRYSHYTPGRGYRFEDYHLVEGYFHSAQALIAHFRDALHGQKPFTIDWALSDLTSLAEVNAEEARYLQVLEHHLSKKSKPNLHE
ncbi:hypothetical protein G7Y89_g5787 [Cudoniella acicularis]|uniref:Uncharacterized protein n=1 Tax=Cudoniella acicularis TaxID=354080 RepID=A0A8H4W333_9HELO|nr:hypothetical protein G7Y89_g5787 [Cudoniella acicularis]